MIRESLTDNSRHAFMLVSAGQGLAFQSRTRTGRTSAQVAGAPVAAPVWLRLVRQGSVFTGYSSSTGTAWTQVATATISMSTNAYVGLAVTSHVASRTATATFSSWDQERRRRRPCQRRGPQVTSAARPSPGPPPTPAAPSR